MQRMSSRIVPFLGVLAVALFWSNDTLAQGLRPVNENCLQETQVEIAHTCKYYSDETLTETMNSEGRLIVVQSGYKCIRLQPPPNQIFCAEATYDRCRVIRTPIRIVSTFVVPSGSGDSPSGTVCRIIESAKRLPAEVSPAAVR